MKKQHLSLTFIAYFLWISPPSVSGQKPCNNFDCAYKKAENFLKQTAYQKALDNLDSAEGYLTDTNTKEKEQIKQLRRRLFVAIEKEKEEAKKARDEAKRQTEIADKEKNRYEKLYNLAKLQQGQITSYSVQTDIFDSLTNRLKLQISNNDSLNNHLKSLISTYSEKDSNNNELIGILDTQLMLCNIVLHRIYFYNEEYGLAYNNRIKKYGFINKEGDIKIDFAYDESTVFDENGFAKVKKNKNKLLIDTLGFEYKLAEDLQQLDSKTYALNISSNYSSKYLKYLKRNTQLKILNLSSNNLSNIPFSMEIMSNLAYLDLSSNKFTRIPVGLEKLSNLMLLNMSNNSISQEDQEKIQKSLPNCKIEF